MKTESLLMRKWHAIGLRQMFVVSATVLFCTAAQAAQPTLSIAEKSLSKVCAVPVPTSVELATYSYLLPITAMGGDAKPLCRLWQEANPADEKSMTLWDGIAGATLLHAVAQQPNIAPHRAMIGKAIVSNPARVNQQLKTVDLAMERIYVHVRDSALLARDWTPKDLADHLRTQAPEVAATLQKSYDKWDADK
jgi:hypothetical protein